jgi:hypothetical protein
MGRFRWRLLRLLALGPVIVFVATACSRDIFDVDVDLASHAFEADFGPSMGTIPTVPCDSTMPGPCSTGMVIAVAASTVPTDVTVTAACDATTSRCYAAARARLAYEVDVLQDDAFVTKVERGATSFVRVLDIAYTIPKNTLTFAIPHVDVYVGPVGTATETDTGVVLLDSIPPIAAGASFSDEPRHLTVADGSPARALIESNIQARTPFVLVVVAAPRLEAGAPVPGGAFEIDTFPKVRVGLPR